MGIRQHNGHISFYPRYMVTAVNHLSEVLDALQRKLAGIDFDTFVGTGSSGNYLMHRLAERMGKHVLIVRKEQERRASHNAMEVIGSLGRRWVFIDDFVSTGESFRRVRDAVREACFEAADKVGTAYDVSVSELVGYAEYGAADSGNVRYTPWDKHARPGMVTYAKKYLSDTPWYEANVDKLDQPKVRAPKPPEIKAASTAPPPDSWSDVGCWTLATSPRIQPVKTDFSLVNPA